MMSGGGIIISVFDAAGQAAGRPRSIEDHTEEAVAGDAAATEAASAAESGDTEPMAAEALSATTRSAEPASAGGTATPDVGGGTTATDSPATSVFPRTEATFSNRLGPRKPPAKNTFALPSSCHFDPTTTTNLPPS